MKEDTDFGQLCAQNGENFFVMIFDFIFIAP